MADRWTTTRGQRPVRIANCSGATSDPGYQMLRQATLGDVDFIVGDYLAELNLAQNAEAYGQGKHPGWEASAWDGLQQSLDAVAAKRTKVVLNGGALNPVGLAQKLAELIAERGHTHLRVAAVVGDDALPAVRHELEQTGNLDAFPPLDSQTLGAHEPRNLHAYRDMERHPVVSAHAYLGARGIVAALDAGADFVICGRVADAALVVGAARHWFGWADDAWDELAGALVAGHLIECSAYVTGANFTGFDKCSFASLIDLPFGIAEVAADGACVITKHAGTRGMVTIDTVKSQLLYEIQGHEYLNSDVSARLDGIEVAQVAPDRVRVSGAVGGPPPPTTKLAVAYKGGFQAQLLANLGGYATAEKHALWQQQLRHGLSERGLLDQFTELEFQQVGDPRPDASTMLASTTYMRIFVAAPYPQPLYGILRLFADYAMQLVSGAHGSADLRSAMPLPYLSYLPALYPRSAISEKAILLAADGTVQSELDAGHPPAYQAVAPRANYDAPAVDLASAFGHTRLVPLGDVALARSGDKGGNVNIGLFVTDAAAWEWFRAYMSAERMRALMGNDWREEFFLERVEFPKLWAVHFVVYGWLGRGAGSTTRLDLLGKGFADWIRARHCDVPVRFLYSR